MDIDSRQLAEKAAKCAYEKKGENIAIFDMTKTTIVCDYFILVTGNSRIHNRAIAEAVDLKMKEVPGIAQQRFHGKEDDGWILIDYGAIIVHVFLENLREYYDLEGLWKSKCRIEYPSFEKETEPA